MIAEAHDEWKAKIDTHCKVRACWIVEKAVNAAT